MSAAARILVVDDDDSLGEALTILFEHAGYRVRHAVDGTTALALARADRPDLAVVDVWLGPESGLNLVPALKAVRPDMEVIVMTAVPTDETIATAFERGADAFACKAIDPPSLLAMIANRLRSQSQGRAER